MWPAETLIEEAEAGGTHETLLTGCWFKIVMHKVGRILGNPTFRI